MLLAALLLLAVPRTSASRADCVPGRLVCRGSTLNLCTAGAWTAMVECRTGTVCSTEPVGCVSAVVAPEAVAQHAGATQPKPKPKPEPNGGGGASSNSSTQAPSGGRPSDSHFPAPHYVIYACDTVFANNVPPSVAELGGYNRLILAFYESTGYENSANVANWVGMAPAARAAVLAEYHAAGVALMLAVFGGTDKPTTGGVDARAFAARVASFVKEYGFDGIDVDYEDFAAFEGGTGVPWINEFHAAVRDALGPGYLISHGTSLPRCCLTPAPIAPWFAADKYADGGYAAVWRAVGASLDWFNLQYYNQADSYTTGTGYPGTSLAELRRAGIPWAKLVLGKPIDQAAAEGGYVPPAELGACVAQARALGWGGGVMFWEWIPKDDPAGILATVVGGGGGGDRGGGSGSSGDGSGSGSGSGAGSGAGNASTPTAAVAEASTPGATEAGATEAAPTASVAEPSGTADDTADTAATAGTERAFVARSRRHGHAPRRRLRHAS
ncbi:hypothetical protein Q8F55_000964 [Vanrija albida]|uniref:GH18 domain-containing protein n=1 Tax=Vanrija albida TaxID=181172 RepID=A0ABR3QFF7_9TREE